MRSSKYTIKQLEVFLAVAREESISKAAEKLHMSQSATSAALLDFEGRYSIQLFDRSAKRLKLNSFGHSVRAKAEQLLRQIYDFDRELRGQEDSGHLRVGASFTIGNYLAIQYLADFLRENPAAEVQFVVGSTPEIVAKVLNFELDIGLIEGELQHEELQLTPWREDEMQIFCSPDSPYAGSGCLSDQQLLEIPWILREAGSGHRQTFDRAMRGLLPNLHILLELPHNEAIKNAVKAGLGVGCLSQIALSEEIDRGAVVPLTVSERTMFRNFYFVEHRRVNRTAAVERWLQLCGHSA